MVHLKDMKKDYTYWDTTKGLFTGLFVFSLEPIIFYFCNSGYYSYSLETKVFYTVVSILSFIILLWFMREGKSPRMIVVGYTYLALLIAFTLVNLFVFNSLYEKHANSGILILTLSIGALVYLYKASKQGITPPSV